MNTQQRELIESIIKQNPAYIGHENLLEQFCAEVYKKSYLLLESVSNVDNLKNYLTKVVDSSVSNVIKNFGLERTNFEIQDSKEEFKLASIKPEAIRPKKQEIVSAKTIKTNDDFVNTYKKAKNKQLHNPYQGLIDPLELISQKPINPSLSSNLIDAVKKIDTKNPSKKFHEIFVMKYIQNLPQSLIAGNLKISQADLSKRFCELVKLVREEIL